MNQNQDDNHRQFLLDLMSRYREVSAPQLGTITSSYDFDAVKKLINTLAAKITAKLSD